MSTLRLALRMLSRDWRAGELTVLVAALMLAVASIGTVGFFADRVKGALAQQANLLLGADVLISGDRPLPDTFASEAAKRGLAATPALKFNSMVQRTGANAGAEGAARSSPTSRRSPRVIRCEARSCSSPTTASAVSAPPASRSAVKRGPMRGSPRASARSAAIRSPSATRR